MIKYEHISLVLQLERKDVAFSRKNILQGLAAESAQALGELGEEGWQLVSVLPFSSGSAGLTTFAATDAALGFLTRAKR